MELNLFFSFNCICHSSKWFFWFVFFFLHFTNLNVSPVTPVTYISQQQNKTGNSVLDMSSLGESEVTISTAENQGSFCGRLAAVALTSWPKVFVNPPWSAELQAEEAAAVMRLCPAVHISISIQ